MVLLVKWNSHFQLSPIKPSWLHQITSEPQQITSLHFFNLSPSAFFLRFFLKKQHVGIRGIGPRCTSKHWGQLWQQWPKSVAWSHHFPSRITGLDVKGIGTCWLPFTNIQQHTPSVFLFHLFWDQAAKIFHKSDTLPVTHLTVLS